MSDVYIAGLDLATGKLLAEPIWDRLLGKIPAPEMVGQVARDRAPQARDLADMHFFETHQVRPLG